MKRPLAAALLFTLPSAPHAAGGAGPWLLRAGASLIDPKSDASGTAAGEVTVDDRIGPTVNLVYFFAPRLALDVLGGLPFEHDIEIGGSKVGSAKHLPPTVSLQYHFAPGAALQPYAGVGVNYTFFLDEQLDSGADLELDDSFGVAAQLGLDWIVAGPWRAGIDVRWVDIDTEAKVDGSRIGTVSIDPLVYSLTVGYRFD